MTPLPARSCAWCGRDSGFGTWPLPNHICGPCYAELLKVPSLTKEEINTLPYGAIELDSAGSILSYNQTEGRLAGLDPARVIGKNFFKQVAPCTDVKAFQGRFADFIRSNTGPQAFNFIFQFPGRPVEVNITFISTDRETAVVLVHALGSKPMP
jgi:photoactive yellow protein